MSIDTQEQALAEARKRWGKFADALEYGFGLPTTIYVVYPGTEDADDARWPAYSGDSWDAAFADADKREGK